MARIDDYKTARAMAAAELTSGIPRAWLPGAVAYIFLRTAGRAWWSLISASRAG